ncbi:MAG: hypothetical protein EPO46_09370, partial [Lysobacter sp.]
MTSKRTPTHRGASEAGVDTSGIDQIVRATIAQLPKPQQALGEAFARAFFKRMSGDEFPQHPPEAWA